MAQHSDWRNFWWLNVALHSFILVALIFMFPETKWHRQHPKEIVAADTPPSTEKTTITETVENSEHVEGPGLGAGMTGLTTVPIAARDPYLHKGTPSKKQFHLWQPCPSPLQVIVSEVWTPIRLHAFPIVEFGAFVVSFSASAFLTINLTQTQNFAAPPYSFSSQNIGFTNFPIFVGALIGLFTNGPLSDWLAARSTKKNRGIREPEMRLPTLIPYVVIMLLGNFIIAFGYQYKWNWKVSSTPL